MSIISKITAVVVLALGLFLLWVSFVGILTPPGAADKVDISSMASTCILVVLVIIMAEIANKLQKIYEQLCQLNEKNKNETNNL